MSNCYFAYYIELEHYFNEIVHQSLHNFKEIVPQSWHYFSELHVSCNDNASHEEIELLLD